MWYCDDCGEKFSEPEYYEEYEEYDNGVNGSWNVACCPYCGSTYVVEGLEEEGEEE